MNNITAFLRTFWQQTKTFWASLTLIKKISFGVALGLIAAAVATAFFMKKPDGYDYLFVDIPQEDVQAIAAELKRSGYADYTIDQRGVKVNSNDLLRLRVQLAQEGLPAKGIVGWEKFDTQDFTRTEFEQNIHKMRAIQGELARTIMSIDGITSARVHIVNPKQSLFVEDQKEPTAAVYIKTKRGTALGERQIKGIVHMVSRSVEGLRPNNITIIDSEGQMLTKIESEDFTSKMTKEMQEYKRSVEKELEDKVRVLVGRVVGPDRVEAKVDATVDFTQEEQTISDVDPEKTALLSKQTTGQAMEGSGLNPTGIPGAKSNVPGEKEEVNATGNRAQHKSESELLNWEVSKTVSKKTMPVGTIKRLTTAVLVDGKQEYPIDGSKPGFEARTDEEMKKIEELVKNAIGFKAGRDEVQVHNMMFQLDPFKVQQIVEQKKETRDYVSTLAMSSAAALGLMLFFMFIVRPYFRWLSYDPERKQNQAVVQEFKPELETQTTNNIQVKEDTPFEKLTPQEQILFLAKHEPKRTTEAIRMLLNPHQTVAH